MTTESDGTACMLVGLASCATRKPSSAGMVLSCSANRIKIEASSVGEITAGVLSFCIALILDVDTYAEPKKIHGTDAMSLPFRLALPSPAVLSPSLKLFDVYSLKTLAPIATWKSSPCNPDLESKCSLLD